MPARTIPAAVALLLGCGSAAGPTEWLVLANASARLEFQATDQSRAAAWLELATTGRQAVAAFFRQPADGPYTVRVYPDRPGFEALWRANGFQPACWMIGRATKSLVEVLSPRLWAGEGCGHSEAETAVILTHELTHVLHAQRNPLPEVNYATALKWFNEGIAIYLAGQLTDGMRARARAWAQSPSPGGLSGLGISADTYAVGGALVELLDQRSGRGALWTALEATSTADLLSALGSTEAEVLAALAGAAGRARHY